MIKKTLNLSRCPHPPPIAFLHRTVNARRPVTTAQLQLRHSSGSSTPATTKLPLLRFRHARDRWQWWARDRWRRHSSDSGTALNQHLLHCLTIFSISNCIDFIFHKVNNKNTHRSARITSSGELKEKHKMNGWEIPERISNRKATKLRHRLWTKCSSLLDPTQTLALNLKTELWLIETEQDPTRIQTHALLRWET